MVKKEKIIYKKQNGATWQIYHLCLQTPTCQSQTHITCTKMQIRDVGMSYRSFQCTEGKSLWRKRSWGRRWAFNRHRLISSTKNHAILKQNRCWWHSEVNSYDNTTTKHFSNYYFILFKFVIGQSIRSITGLLRTIILWSKNRKLSIAIEGFCCMRASKGGHLKSIFCILPHVQQHYNFIWNSYCYH